MAAITRVGFALAALTTLAFAAGCGGGEADVPTSTTTTATGAGGGSSTTSTGEGGAAALDELLARLRADPEAAMAEQAAASGWPAPVDGGYLVVSIDPLLTEVAGDHDAWAGTPMQLDAGFAWLVLEAVPDSHYKLKGGADFVADPWARAYTYDEFGEMSLIAPTAAHLDRFFGVGDAAMEPRTVRIWVPEGAPTHVLYAHDGQNLFDPAAFFGGWKLAESAPPGMLIVGIDNTPARMDEYTHVPDVIGGQTMGGAGDAYADFLEGTVRPLVAARYGEPARKGLMGSSLGGLISLHVADRFPGEFDFAASLSGTSGWGSIGAQNETMIERYAAHGHQATSLYVDSGGDGQCFDSDGDGIEDDDPSASDNYCENAQLYATLLAAGWVDGADLHYVWEPGATHDEAAWAGRAPLVLELFAGL